MSRLLPLDDKAVRAPGAGRFAGAKAARLARAAGAGLAVLPGWVVPVREGRPALSAGAAAVRHGQPAAARRAVLAHRLGEDLAAELRDAVTRLGGQVIVRSSSPLETDPRWSGAFSSIAEVGPDDVVSALRSCWASAFAVDPLKRLGACGLPPEALELGALIQPQIRPAAGGVARVAGGGAHVTVEGVRGHPGALLSGWAEGAAAEVPPAPGSARLAAAGAGPVRSGQAGLTDLLGQELVEAVAALASRAWRILGDDMIEWAADGGGVWLLQSLRSGDPCAGTTPAVAEPAADRATSELPGRGADCEPLASRNGTPPPAARQGMPLLAAAVLRRGEHIPGRPGAPGTAVGRLLACRPHERPPGDCEDAILLVDRPVPALAPLLFAARGVIARTGAAASHLAEVARSLGVPMVVGCRPEPVTGPPPVPAGRWLAAINGSTGEVALLPAETGG
jgi:phosphohistidine swiveling domain-containing protein